MLYILVIWVSYILYLSHKSLKAVLFKFLNLRKLVQYKEKRTVVRSTAAVRPLKNVIKDRLQHMLIPAFMQKEIREEGTGNPYIVCTLLSTFWTSYQIFQKARSLKRPNFSEGFAWKERGDFFQGGCNFLHKKSTKIWIFNEKKSW